MPKTTQPATQPVTQSATPAAQYYAYVAYEYGSGFQIDTTPDAAYSKAARHIGKTAAQARKLPSYVLEFPASATITHDSWGAWRADVAPLRVVRMHNLPDDFNPMGMSIGG